MADEDGRARIVADPATLEELNRVELPARAHDLAVDAVGSVWTTLIGEDRPGRFQIRTHGAVVRRPLAHDLIAASDGRIEFSNWDGDVPSVYDPITGFVEEAAAGVVEPHHSAVGAGEVSRYRTTEGRPSSGSLMGGRRPSPVGPVPHHIALGDDIAIMAVSGPGQAVFDGSGVIGRFDL